LIDAAVEVDALARLRTQPRVEMGYAGAVDDAPEGHWIGAGRNIER
jgi:hypothetical protein